MATTTTNYGMIKPATTDNYDIGVFNGNADKADAQMKVNADAISTHKTDTVAHMTQAQKDQLAAAAVHDASTNNPHRTTAAQVGACARLPIMHSGTLISYIQAAINAGNMHGTFGVADVTNIDNPNEKQWGTVEYIHAASNYVHVIWRYEDVSTFYERIFIDGQTTWLTDWVNIADGGHAASADYSSNSVPLTTPGVRNIDIITKDTAVPTGLADGTVVLRYDP